MDGNVNRARIALACALLLGGICLWQLAESMFGFYADKSLAEQRYASCLEKIELQAATQQDRSAARNQIWPCWHQQLAANQYNKKGALFVSLMPPKDKESGLYLATLLILSLVGLAARKKRQRHTNQTAQRTDPDEGANIGNTCKVQTKENHPQA